MQGRLPEIDVLQRQISAAHEELSDLRYKLDEQRSAAAAKEASLQGERQALQGQLEAAAHAHERLQLEASAAATRAGQHEKQLQELYELCTTQQGAA
jgi:predicted  nucleic acid-binding Zn-ribbon protein